MNLAPLAIQKFFDNNGNPMNGGLLFTYVAGTTTKVATYTDDTGGSLNTNPTVLDFRGEARVWLDPTLVYKFTLAPPGDTDPPTRPIWTVDQITSALSYANLIAIITQSFIGLILYPRTAAEIAAGVTPTFYYYEPGDSRRYGVLSNGSTDDAAALQRWLSASAGDVQARLYRISGNARCGTQLSIPSNSDIWLGPNSCIEATIDNTPIMKGSGVSNVRISGTGQILGVQATADWPSPSSNGDGLIMFTNNGGTRSSNIRISDIYVNRAWCLISALRTDGLWIYNTRCETFYRYGILASLSSDFHINDNNVATCNATVTVAYGIMATGDAAGGTPQRRCEINGNSIKDVPSWDGIMSHDCAKLSVIGNTIENCRSGIDLGPLVATNVVTDLIVMGNTIDLGTTNTWGAAPAAHIGIGVVGVATAQINRATVVGNIINNFGQMAGATLAGDPSAIDVEYVTNVTIADNVIANGDNNSGNAPGIFFVGTITNGTCIGNTIQGDFPSGSVRLTSVTGMLQVGPNTSVQTTPANNAVFVSGSTVSLAMSVGATNSTAPFAQGTSTITWVGEEIEGSVVYDPPNLADGAGVTTTVTVTGAALGDLAIASFGLDLSGITVTAYVSAVNTVSVRFQNESGGALDLASSTLRARVVRLH